MNENKSRTIIEQPQGESELVRVLVTVFVLCAVVGIGLFYGGYWFGPVLFILGVLGLLILEIGGWRK